MCSSEKYFTPTLHSRLGCTLSFSTAFKTILSLYCTINIRIASFYFDSVTNEKLSLTYFIISFSWQWLSTLNWMLLKCIQNINQYISNDLRQIIRERQKTSWAAINQLINITSKIMYIVYQYVTRSQLTVDSTNQDAIQVTQAVSIYSYKLQLIQQYNL